MPIKRSAKVIPTEKQKRAAKAMVVSGSKKEALKKAGYSDAISIQPHKVLESEGYKEAAKPFGCHEEAKRVMRTLKGVVGPGFGLQRFFVRHD